MVVTTVTRRDSAGVLDNSAAHARIKLVAERQNHKTDSQSYNTRLNCSYGTVSATTPKARLSRMLMF